MITVEALFTVGDYDVAHKPNTKDCGACWSGFPVGCPCGGLIHAEFGDEYGDGDYWLYRRCDQCDSTQSPEC